VHIWHLSFTSGKQLTSQIYPLDHNIVFPSVLFRRISHSKDRIDTCSCLGTDKILTLFHLGDPFKYIITCRIHFFSAVVVVDWWALTGLDKQPSLASYSQRSDAVQQIEARLQRVWQFQRYLSSCPQQPSIRFKERLLESVAHQKRSDRC